MSSSRVSRTMKSAPLSMNACTGAPAPLPRRVFASSRTSLPVRSGFCSLPESVNSFSMIFCDSTNQEWSCPVCAQVRERAERVEAGVQRHRQALAGGVEPDRRRAGEDPDAVIRPDRIPVLDALDVVPHAVAVDQARAGVLGDRQHRAVHVGGDAGDHGLRSSAQPCRPVPCARGRGCRRCRPTRRWSPPR